MKKEIFCNSWYWIQLNTNYRPKREKKIQPLFFEESLKFVWQNIHFIWTSFIHSNLRIGKKKKKKKSREKKEFKNDFQWRKKMVAFQIKIVIRWYNLWRRFYFYNNLNKQLFWASTHRSNKIKRTTTKQMQEFQK